METRDACALCLRSKDSVNFGPLLDVNDYQLGQMTLNTIALIGPYKLCSKCCRELTFVGQLLYKWRRKIVATLDLAKEETVIKKEEPIEQFSDVQNVIPRNNWIATEVDEKYDSPEEFENCNDEGLHEDDEEQQYAEIDGFESCAKALIQLDQEVIEEKGGVNGNLPDTGSANAIFARKRGRPRKQRRVKIKSAISTMNREKSKNEEVKVGTCEKARNDDLDQPMMENEENSLNAKLLLARKRGRPRGSFKKKSVIEKSRAGESGVDQQNVEDETGNGKMAEGECGVGQQNVGNKTDKDDAMMQGLVNQNGMDLPKGESYEKPNDANPVLALKRGRPRNPNKQRGTPMLEKLDIAIPLPEKQDSYNCHICSKPFKIRAYFVLHIANHDKTHTCAICGKLFTKKHSLTTHLKTHENGQYSCDQCDKVYSGKSSLHQHKMVAHGTAKRDKLCRFCSAAFIVKANLINHEKVHLGEKPYSCATCGKKFLRERALRKHELIHTVRVKSHACEICGSLFYTKMQKDSHKIQHNPPTMPCPYKCGRMFRRTQKALLHGKVCSTRELMLLD